MNRRLISLILLISFLICLCGTSCSRKTSETTIQDNVTSPEQLRVSREYTYRDEYAPLGYTTDGFYRYTSFCENFIACIKDYYTDEAEIALQSYNDFTSNEHLPTDDNGDIQLSSKSLTVYNYDAELITNISLNDLLGYMYYCPVITIDSNEVIHLITEIRQLNVDEYEYYDCKFNPDGTLISSTLLQFDNNYILSDVEIADDGSIVLFAQDSSWMGVILKFDSEGNLIAEEKDAANNCSTLININDTIYAVLNRYTEDNDSVISIVSPVDNVFEGEVNDGISLDIYANYYSPHGNGFLYLDEGNNQIKYYNLSNSEVNIVFNLSDNNGIFGSNDFFMNSDNEIISIATNGIDYSYYMCTYIPLESNYIDSREVLVIGGVGISSDPVIRNMVFHFNLDHEDYRIEIYDYALNGTSTDDNSIITEFFFQMNDGEAPDILIDLPFDSICGSDYLVNLNEYMSSDINVEEYNSTLINLNHDNYYIPATYRIRGMLTFEDDFTRLSSYSDFYELDSLYSGNQYSAILANISKEALLNIMLQVDLDRFFNTATHSVNFDSDEFRELLQWVNYVGDTNVFMDEGDYSSSFLTNEYTMYEYYEYFDRMNIFMLEQNEFERNVNFVGLPTNDNSIYGFVPSYNFAITQNCSVPNIAWDFIKMVLSYDMQCVFSRVGFAVNNAANEDTFIDSCHDFYISSSLNLDDIDSAYAELEDILYSENAVVVRNNPQLFAIVTESASAYFDGSRDINEVTAIIQNQAETIMSESY